MTVETDARLKRWTQISTFVAIPALLAALTATQSRLQNPITQFLVLPPFAVVIYIIFQDPFGKSANLRSIVILPCVGAAVGELSFHYLGMTPQGVAVDTLSVLSSQMLLRARMPPALALSVLAMLLHVQLWTYVVGVAEASSLIGIVFFLWRRFTISQFQRETRADIASTPVLLPEISQTRVP